MIKPMIAWCKIILLSSCVGGALTSKYDGSALLYDPKGRMFQVEYAMEATRRGRTVVGVCGDGCVALVARDPTPSASCRAVAPREVREVDSHVGIAASGLRSDVQYVADCARTWCSEHRFIFGAPMPCQMLARRIADLVHSCTTRGGKRPLAVDILVAGVDEHTGASLYQVQATGAFQRYRAVAIGASGAVATERLVSPPAWVGGVGKEGRRQATDDDNQEEFSTAAKRMKEAGVSRGEPVPGDVVDEGDIDDGRRSEDYSGATGNGSPASDGGGSVQEGEERSATDQRGSGHVGQITAREQQQQEQRRKPRRPRLAAEHRAALKRALAALWESEDEETGDGGGGGASSSGARAAAAVGDEETRGVRGGLMASELSATLYGMPQERGGMGGGPDGLDAGEEVDGVQRIECTVEDCEEMLLELEAEEMETRRGL